ncbi:hypothetical protein SAMN05216227_100686 [Pseudorhodobacter antarcticus]|jgi:hypothetical protein|uniref:DUF1223 domain-containing protein n=1 Tax=Pseudorhodobacter antarcticus TaxID=1077947 RepID=A0A1H8D5V5_9RHOB|nr:DUF1223 domain-containing protein [Pseudorhodobacter antarcticus]SEN02582.1 hypothetical protein SAMN05216227_100686 [Pseudorhodobacter antarcticus]
MKHIVTTVCAAWMALAPTAQAQSTNAVVVELFTSQGCSSCPPADAILGKLSADDRVIALSLHVDYWDYLGWKDKFASPQFTARQKEYAHHARDKMVFTPQIVVQGQARVVGNRGAEVEAAIQEQLGQVRQTGLRLTRQGGAVLIEAPALGVVAPVRVQLVRFSPAEKVLIERGENAGKTITYHNVVTSWEVLEMWNGASPLALVAPAPGPAPLVVILQADGPADIFAAAVLR